MNGRRWTSNATLLVLGLLALLAISPIGHVAAVVSAITFIGIPIALLIVAIPSVFLLALAVRLAIGAWDGYRSGRFLLGAAYAVALILMSDFFIFRAWRVNDWLDRRVTALVEGDKDELGPPAPVATLAVLRNTLSSSDAKNPCDDLCRRLLLTGAVKRVIAVTAAPLPKPRAKQKAPQSGRPEWPVLEPAADMSGTAWSLEDRERCDDPGPLGSERPVQLPQPKRGTRPVRQLSSEALMRLEIAKGNCLVGVTMPVSAADAVLAYGHVATGVSEFNSGYDAWADTISAWRIAVWRNREGAKQEQYRRTGVSWLRLPWALVPVLVGGSELRTANGWLRVPKFLNRMRYEHDLPVGELVQGRLGLNLGLDATASVGAGEGIGQPSLRPEQARVVDRMLAATGAPSQNESKVLADYLVSLEAGGARGQGTADEGDSRRIVRILEERRLELPAHTVGAVRFALAHEPSTAPMIAAALFARLAELPRQTKDDRARTAHNEQVRAVASSLAELPAAAVVKYRSEVVDLLRDPQRRYPAQRLISRLDLFGPAIAPDIFAMMDDAAALRGARGKDKDAASRHWASVWRAGAQSICRMAPQIAGSLDQLRSRAYALAMEGKRVADDVVAAAMMRMGADDADVHATLAIDALDEKAMRSFGATLRRARRDDACH